MLDFYNIIDKNRNNLLYSLSEDFFLEIERNLITNQINFDLYGTTRLYQSHIIILIDILQKNKLNKSTFFQFLIKIKNQDIALIVEGN